MRLPTLLLLSCIPALALACVAEPDDYDYQPDSDSADETIGVGVKYEALGGMSNNKVAIVYGGFGASDAASSAWANELAQAHFLEQEYAHLFSVRGPATVAYDNKEIGNSKIVARLVALAEVEGPVELTVIAHSSGGFVANELFAQIMRRRSAGELDISLEYYNLDGAGLRTSIDEFAGYCPVYSRSAFGRSHNASLMDSEGNRAEAAGRGEALEVDASESGCRSTWCLHDALITSRPHRPGGLDVAHDYTDFATRSVVSSYLEHGCAPRVEAPPPEPVPEEPQP